LALGIVLIYRTTGIMNFAHWAIGLLGVIAYALLTGFGVSPVIAFVVGMVISTASGVGAYRFIFKRMPRSNQIGVILITLAVAQLFSAIGALILGFRDFTKLPGWLPVRDMQLFGLTVRSTEIITFGISIAIAIGFLFWFRLSRTGRGLRAVAQNREAAMLAGIDDVKYASIAWGIGSALAGLAVLLVLPHVAAEEGGLINVFDLTPLGTLLIPAFGAALVGGLVNLPMALVGGFIFGIAREMLVLAPQPWSELRGAIAALLIVFLLLLRTERFFATRQELEALET
ncbi:MAG: branched-chain amino acid ABC transporter permease, partial [Actinobacteria bacterium]|nr:branched-chain amino acid ABC transporter permease [Actinomycetota bacterium]